MCGFFGIIFEEDRDDLGKIMVKAGSRLSYRGYDTSGVVAIDKSGNFDLRKDKGKIDEVEDELKLSEVRGNRGIIQLRWATYGVPCQRNAQPHHDCKKEIFGAHNGNILNTPELRENLKNSGHVLQGENDGELIPHLIEKYLSEDISFIDSIENTIDDLDGDYAFITAGIHEDAMWSVKKGSSLFLGKGDGFVCVSSDLASILDNTRQIITLRDGELVKFTPTSFNIIDLETGKKMDRETEKTTLTVEEIEKGSYDHFMIKEINEMPQRAREHINLLTKHQSYRKASELLSKGQRTFITGAGTSFHAALLGKYYLSCIAGTLLNHSFASEFEQLYSNTLQDDDLLIAVSQSGETKDVKNVLDIFREKGGRSVIAMVNTIGSTIALNSDLVLPINSQLEVSVPATKTFINQAISFLYLACRIAELRGIEPPDINFPSIPEILKKSIENGDKEIEPLIDILNKEREFYILGFGLTYPSALECALKVKEVVYSHVEGMYSGEFKHGPLSIVQEGYPVVFITTLEDKHFVLSHINEIKTRDGLIITISPEDDELREESDIKIDIPVENRFLVPISATVYGQILSYRMSTKKGIDPDYPRNISKTITVD